MIVVNNYLKYDMTLEEYYITINAILNYTPYTESEVSGVFGNNLTGALKNISRLVYRVIYSEYIGLNRDTHKKYMKKKIYDNSYGEVTSLMFAMLETVKGAIESGMDLNAYIDEPKETMPSTAWQELRQVGLIDRSQKQDYELDITYTDDELTRWQ